MVVLWELFWGFFVCLGWTVFLNGRVLMFFIMIGFFVFFGYSRYLRYKAVVVSDRFSGCVVLGFERFY